jgi:hypothetical protein
MLTGKRFVDPLDMPFSRRGAYLCFANANGGSNELGKAQLWIANSRQRSNDRNTGTVFNGNKFRQVHLELIKDGQPVQSVISTTPYELTLESEYGSARFCIGTHSYAAGRGEDGLTLRITPAAPAMMLPGAPLALDLRDGTWKTSFGNYFLLFVPAVGKLVPGPQGSLELVPDEKGVFEIIFEESLVEPKRRDKYLSYDESVAAVRADFDGFKARLAPSFPEKYSARGEEALWTLWGLTVIPEAGTLYKRHMVKMMRSSFEGAFSWQHGMHTFFLAHDLDLAWELLLASFDNQDATGNVADSVSYNGHGDTSKPPTQGVGLIWLLEHYDITDRPKAELEFLYNGLAGWTNYHLNHRDLDGDGLYEYQNAGETGWEACSYFRLGFPLASPDANAYLALQMEATGRLGRIIGKSEDECKYWEDKAKATIGKIIDKFWTEKGWESVNIVTGARGGLESVISNCTLVLGKRLPQEIIDKSISNIYDVEGFDTPFGLASERLDSPYFQHGWCQGSIATPVQALMAVAFENCGRPDLAKKVGVEYLNTMSEFGLLHIHSPYTGEKEYGNIRFCGEERMFNSGWTAGNYIFFAERYGN